MSTSPVAPGVAAHPLPPEAGPPVRLAAGLWQVAGPGITHPGDAGAYLITAGQRPALVDCGSGRGNLDAALAAVGVLPRDLAVVVATHGHVEHIGDGARLSGLRIPVLMHPGDAQPFAAFTPDPCEDGDRIDLGAGVLLDIVHTPGHTPGSVCVVVHLFGRRVLLAGEPLEPQIGSAEAARLAGLELDALAFGHGPARLLDVPQALRTARRERRTGRPTAG